MNTSEKFSSSAGIAIGPILFVLAILALLAAVMASGGGDFQVAGGADNITNNIVAQANLIRSTINQCNMQYQISVSTGSASPVSDQYPSPSGATAVSALVCNPIWGSGATTPTLWNDSILGNKLLPPPTSGFNAWQYVDAWSSTAGSDGGRCFWTSPNTSNPASSSAITSGLSRAASKFNSSAAYSNSTEVNYNVASASQKFVVWITLPASGTPNSNCVP